MLDIFLETLKTTSGKNWTRERAKEDNHTESSDKKYMWNNVYNFVAKNKLGNPTKIGWFPNKHEIVKMNPKKKMKSD